MELHRAFEMGQALLREHGLHGWRLELDTAKRRAGVCRYDARVIGLSAPLARIHGEAEVRDTVLHEIAHALVGPAHGHDRVWRDTATRIGCSGSRCVPADAPRLPGAWVGVCPAGHTRERHRRPERVMSCPQCHPAFSAAHLFEWTHRGRPAQMHPNYLAELESVRHGRPVRRYAVGSTVRILVPGDYHGRTGRVRKVGRTSYVVELKEAWVRVVFAGVEGPR